MSDGRFVERALVLGTVLGLTVSGVSLVLPGGDAFALKSSIALVPSELAPVALVRPLVPTAESAADVAATPSVESDSSSSSQTITISVTIPDITAPVVALNPTVERRARGLSVIRVAASDDDAVADVTVHLDGAAVAAVPSSDGGWQVVVPTSQVARARAVWASASDASGNTGVSVASSPRHG